MHKLYDPPAVGPIVETAYGNLASGASNASRCFWMSEHEAQPLCKCLRTVRWYQVGTHSISEICSNFTGCCHDDRVACRQVFAKLCGEAGLSLL